MFENGESAACGPLPILLMEELQMEKKYFIPVVNVPQIYEDGTIEWNYSTGGYWLQ